MPRRTSNFSGTIGGLARSPAPESALSRRSATASISHPRPGRAALPLPNPTLPPLSDGFGDWSIGSNVGEKSSDRRTVGDKGGSCGPRCVSPPATRRCASCGAGPDSPKPGPEPPDPPGPGIPITPNAVFLPLPDTPGDSDGDGCTLLAARNISFGGGASTTTTVMSSCNPRSSTTVRMSASAASSAESAPAAIAATSPSLIAFHSPSVATTRRPPWGGSETRVHSG
eukprot:31435-Pelagococcus_subviridis.AAC.1